MAGGCIDEETAAALIAGALDRDEARRVEEHADACSSCREFISALARAAPPASQRSGPDVPSDLAPTSMGSPDAPAATVPLFTLGDKLGRYVVLERIGMGGMGVVYAAYDPELDRKVALKLLRGLRPSQEEARARLVREAQALARLSDPHVVAAHDIGTYEDQVFLSMEFVDGGTLADWVRAAPRPWRQVLALYLAAGRGLAAAHRAGLVHRDFKPDNVLVGSDGRPRVTDFGLARDLGRSEPVERAPSPPADAVSLTRTGAVLGTPAYMAPEQQQGCAADARSDQYSFCVSLYEALWGVRPGAEPSEPPPLGGVPARLWRILARGLARDPAARHASMDALLAELAADPTARRRRALVLVAGALVVAAVAALPWAMARRQSQLCAGGAARFDAVWSRSRAAAVHAAIAAAGASWGEKAAAEVAAAIARYRGAWVDMYTDACRATRVRGEQSDNALELRMSCLDERLEDVDALATALAGGQHVKHAIDAAYALPPVAACADVAALAAPVRPPTDPALRRRVDGARKQLAAITASYNTGDFANARARAGALADEVRALGYAPLTAEVELLYGHVQERLADYADADQTLFSAALSAEAGGADETAAEAWAQLLASYVSAGDFADGQNAARQAEAAVARLRGRRADLEAKVYRYRSNLYGQHGDYERAIADGKRALQLAEAAATGVDDLQLGYALFSLGTIYGYATRPAQALEYHQRGCRIIFAVYPAGHPNRDSCDANLATDLLNLGRWDEARRVAEALVATVDARGAEGISTAFALDNLAVAWVHQGAFDKALGYFRRALALRERKLAAGNIQLAFEWAEIADAERRAGRLDEAAAAAGRAAAIVDAQTTPLSTLFGYPVLTVIGDVALARGLYAKARPRYERAIALSVGEKQPPAERAGAQFGLARTLWAMGQRPRALELARQARAGFDGDPSQTDELKEVDAWLAERSGGRAAVPPPPRRTRPL